MALIQLLDLRCNHDKQKHPHGMIQGNYKGKMISKMAQEWPTILCRTNCTGIEKALQAQGADFTEAHLVYADLSFANLHDALFLDAKLDGADLFALIDHQTPSFFVVNILSARNHAESWGHHVKNRARVINKFKWIYNLRM